MGRFISQGAGTGGQNTGNLVLGGGGGGGAMKDSIFLFDYLPGTRSVIIPTYVNNIRVFVVGGGGPGAAGNPAGSGGPGGGYAEKIFFNVSGQTFSYTVGAGGVADLTTPVSGGTSSFGGVLSATGGAATLGTPGVGSGGDRNTSGGAGTIGSSSLGGGSSGHRFGNGSKATSLNGAGWISSLGAAGVDGFGLGMIPSGGGASLVATQGIHFVLPGYGAGGITTIGAAQSSGVSFSAGIGGGGSTGSSLAPGGFGVAGIGGGGSGNYLTLSALNNGGSGVVGIEILG